MTTNYQTGEQSSTDLKDQIKQDLGNKAREASRQFADKGKEKAEALTSKAADKLEDVEAVAEAQAEALERQGWTDLSHYVHEMATGIGDLSNNLRNKSVDELVRSAAELAQRNTGLFLLGSIAIGFGLSRLVKAAPAAHAEAQRAAGSTETDGNAYPAGESNTASAYEPGSGNEYQPFETH
jgi:hypothetical protein